MQTPMGTLDYNRLYTVPNASLNFLLYNILLSMLLRWDDDVVFKNCAKAEPKQVCTC